MKNYTDDELKKISKTYRLLKKLKRFELIFYLLLLVLFIYLALTGVKTQ